MISPVHKKETFSPVFEELSRLSAKTAPKWLDSFRNEGASRFKKLGLPTLKDEEWKYTDVSPIAAKKFRIAEKAEIAETKEFNDYISETDIAVVFVNGFFSEKYSQIDRLPKNVSILSFADIKAEKKQGASLLLSEPAPSNEDAFAALNRALLQDGLVIDIADKVICDKLIHIVHIVSGNKDDIVTLPRLFVSLGKSAEAEILESYVSFSNSSYFTNAVTDVYLNEDAKLRLYKAQKESANAFHVGNMCVSQKRNSQFETFSFSTGGQLTRNNLRVILNGEGAGATLNGLYAVGENQLVDNHTTVEHRMPNCLSNQLYKGILDGNAKAVFNGKILVSQIAQQTNSYQLNKNLLLGKDCQINTKPQLEIFADDVRCTHGATIGQLNEDEMFYLLTRAIPKTVAVKMLSRGFVDDIFNKISNSLVRKKMDGLLTKAFSVLQ